MTICFYLLPGCRLPKAEARQVLARLPKSVRDAFLALGAGREPPGIERLSEPLHEYSPHLAWLWKVLAHRPGAPAEAPYAWMASGGPALDQEFWRLTPYRQAAGGTGAPIRALIENAQIPRAAAALDAVIASAGMRLMISGTDFYLCRRTPWALAARPFDDLACAPNASLPELVAGKARSEALALLGKLAEAARAALPDAGITGFWLSGGGPCMGVLPPSSFRAIAADNPVVRAWAAAASIPKTALVSSACTERDQTLWKSAPTGDRIVLLDGLLEPWRRSDWDDWCEALPGVLRNLRLWRSHERESGIDQAAWVLFGQTGAATLLPQRKGLNPLRYLRTSLIRHEEWFFDGFAEGGRP